MKTEDKIKEAGEVTVERTSLLNKLSLKECQLRDLEEVCRPINMKYSLCIMEC